MRVPHLLFFVAITSGMDAVWKCKGTMPDAKKNNKWGTPARNENYCSSKVNEVMRSPG